MTAPTVDPHPAPLPPPADAALAPVRRWLLDAARRDADAEVAAARVEAAERLATARTEAAGLVEEARAEGAAQGAEAAARELARARREARATVLRTQAALREQLLAEARTAAATLRETPEYPALRESLARRAQQALGAGAVVSEAPEGGVVATDGARRVDLSLPVLAERAVARLGMEVTGLWT